MSNTHTIRNWVIRTASIHTLPNKTSEACASNISLSCGKWAQHRHPVINTDN